MHLRVRSRSLRGLPNPVLYSYMKDAKEFAGEHELRITLSTLGIGNVGLADATVITFPPNLQLSLDSAGPFMVERSPGSCARTRRFPAVSPRNWPGSRS